MHLHVLDATVLLEGGAQACVIDARHEEVLVRVRQAEELVADGASDHVGVEAEPADITADGSRHARHCRRSRPGPPHQMWATASISTSAPDGSFATSNVERAGGRSPTWRA